jgi:hypothetical protein
VPKHVMGGIVTSHVRRHGLALDNSQIMIHYPDDT